MMRVTVEIVPHGDESKAHVIEQVEIAQVEAFDADPDGVRSYALRRGDERWSGPVVRHRRGDGAATARRGS